MEAAEKGCATFASDNLLIDMDAQEKALINVPGAGIKMSIVEQAERDSADSIYADSSAQALATQPKSVAQAKVIIDAVGDVQSKFIADRATLKSLKSIYADDNVQVRATQAMVGRLQWEAAELVGKSNLTATGRKDPQPLYISMRNLPLLWTKYADLYRTVGKDGLLFGISAQEYELAKIAELRDTPSMSVLDPPNVPEGKSWPPRLLIVSLSILCSICMAVAWIFGNECWRRWPEDEQKLFAIEVFQTIGAHFRLDVKKSWSTRKGENGN